MRGDVNRYMRTNYLTKIRMRKFRALRKGYGWDPVRKVAVIPREQMERIQREKQERALRKMHKAVRGSRRRRTGIGAGVGRATTGQGGSADVQRGSQRARRSARRRSRRRSADSASPRAAKRLKLEEEPLPDVANVDIGDIDRALHEVPEKYENLTRNKLLAELSIRDAALRQQVSLYAHAWAFDLS